MHSALQRKNSGMEPSCCKVSRQETLLLQLGDPCNLMINIAVADSILQGPLELVMWPCDGELGQVEEIGTLIWRSDVEESLLPVFAGLDDFRTLVLVLPSKDQAASCVGHVNKLDRLATFYSRRAGFPSLRVMSSEVEKPLP